MFDMDRLYEALHKASQAVESGCGATTRAYLTIAQRELLQAINATSGKEREYADAAYAYVSERCNESASPSDKIWILQVFWEGFEHGWEDWDWHDGVDPIYEAGYDFGQNGMLNTRASLEDDGFELVLEGDDDSG
jgi:hypothetical protein